jgi:hypothetical protein
MDMRKTLVKVALFLTLFVTAAAYSYMIEPPPIFPNSEVSVTKGCIWATIRTSKDNKPFLDIVSNCDERYAYYVNGKKKVLINNTTKDWNWTESQRRKKDFTLYYRIDDPFLLTRFYDSVDYKIRDHGEINASLVNLDNDSDSIAIKGQVSIGNDGSRQIHLENVKSDCIKPEVVDTHLRITSTCKGRYIFESMFSPNRMLLVNKEDYDNKDAWWNELKTYLNDKNAFEATTEIWDDSIKEQK